MSTVPSCTSVIIPVLNGERHLADAVASVLGQLDDADEILVVDDRSTDRTQAVLHRYRQRLTVLTGPTRGPSAARNLGLAAAKGDFIAFLDHDDLWPAGRHATLVKALGDDRSANAAIGRMRVVTEGPDDVSEYVKHYEGRYHPAILMSCLYRRELIDRVGLFDETLRFGEDTDYFVRLREIGARYAYCDVDSLIYRRHSHNATKNRPPQTSIAMDVLARKRARARKAGISPMPRLHGD